DEDVRIGEEYVKSQEIPGSQNTLYDETWVNGVLVSGSPVKTVVTSQPVPCVIVRGTKVIPGLGTGTFRWPVDNPSIICGWGGYVGHRAIDIVDRYNSSGPIYAADNGTVYINGWQSINGYYMVINHNNGYYTYYGHMAQPGYFEEGENVEKGDVIGQIGRTGLAFGNHTHFFIVTSGDIYGNGRLNPCNGYLPCDGL
ncbi:MAG: peptidoglycan DD-metalloendopeptidase family protein, partial [Erysipelotrichaceae bacterium]|nr:peptidoglycan DD-metalloendopeptidase family protein [Erysipelotrichaceae bacterium]